MKINFEDIIIPEFYTQPSMYKLKKCRREYKKGVFDRDLVVDDKNVLKDGYVLYCVLKEHDYKGEVDVVLANRFHGTPTTYIYGKHAGDDTERVWYINMGYKKVRDKIGQLADVETRRGIQTITITNVKRLTNPPYNGLIRKVVHI